MNFPSIDLTPSQSLYESIFELLHTYIYGGVELTSDMSLVLTLCATAACLFAVSVPFAVVWGFWRRILR